MSGCQRQTIGNVPDRDILYRSLAGPWRRSCSLACGGLEPEALAPNVEKALCRTLRDQLGCPGLGQIGVVVWEAITGNLAGAEDRLEQVLYSSGNHPHTAIAVEAALGFLGEGGMGRSCEETCVQVGEATLARIAAQQFWGRGVRARLMSSQNATYDQVRQYELRCVNRTRFRDLARRVLADETASHLRAPLSRRAKEDLADILARPVGAP
jgi:hypothetical protein